MIVHVALPTPVADYFDYLPGDIPAEQIIEGIRVQAPFGSRQLVGVVVGTSESSDHDSKKLKTITKIIDSSPLLDKDILLLLRRAARYYHHPLGDVFATALPKLLRTPQTVDHTDVPAWKTTSTESADNLPVLARAKTRRAMFEAIQASDTGLNADQLREQFKGWKKQVESLLEEQLVTQIQRQPVSGVCLTALSGPILNEEQQASVEVIRSTQDSFSVTLLEGVTGSGKTEVFLSSMRDIVGKGKQVLMLVPEIGLTPQLKDRVGDRFQTQVISMHSGMNNTERMKAWRAASLGEAAIVLGTRSAVFTPMPNLGMIIIDEEHDTSLKQQEGFRYHARDLAILRAQISDIPVLLASATPSLESFHKSRSGQFQLTQLKERAGGAQPPRFTCVDLRREPLEEGLSITMRQHMRQHLEAGHQVLVFINRRGYAPVMLCHDCGETVDCPHCDKHTTFHSATNSLRCHHCGYITRPPTKCPACGGGKLTHVGIGTERLEIALKEKFPKHSVIRLDRDTMSRKDALENTLAEIRRGEHQIIIGTQMLAKGHDFPNITLVGIVDVDQGLFSSELRALERLGQQILQVGGRAGRGEKRGDVVLQTHQPDHPLLQLLLSKGYEAFAQQILKEREAALFPPFGYLALLRCSAPDSSNASDFLRNLVELAQPMRPQEVMVLGPIPSSMEKRAGRYHHQLLILSPQRKALHGFLSCFLPVVRKQKTAGHIRWSIDVDPMESV